MAFWDARNDYMRKTAELERERDDREDRRERKSEPHIVSDMELFAQMGIAPSRQVN